MCKLLLTEYVTSTYTPNSVYRSLFAEAYGMLKSLLKSLRGRDIDVVVTLSSYIYESFIKDLSTDKVIIVNNDYPYVLEELRESVDYVIAIAPPRELIDIVEIFGGKFLGPSISLVRALSNKYEVISILNRCGLKTPQTFIYSHPEEWDPHEVSLPVVVKPLMSAGAECVYVAKDNESALESIRRVIECDPQRYAVVQEYIEGYHGSISTIMHNNEIYLYSLNLQLISIVNNRITYHGNVLPLRDVDYVRLAEDVVEKMMLCLSGLRGYIGIDIVWNDEDMYVIEVNPRFTTSGIAIAEVYPDLGKVLVGYKRPSESTYLGDLIQGYAYVVKCVDRYYSHSLESGSVAINHYSDELISVGTVTDIEDMLKATSRCNGNMMNNLVYNIRALK